MRGTIGAFSSALGFFHAPTTQRSTKVLEQPPTKPFDAPIEAGHEEGACCHGCKVEGWIAQLTSSTDKNDQRLGKRFQEALTAHNRQLEYENNPRARIRGC